MLTVRRAGAFSRDYVVSDGERTITTLTLRRLRERIRFSVDDTAWWVRGEGWGGRLVLRREGEARPVATAERAGVFSSRQIIRLDDRRLELAPTGFWRRRYVLRHGDREIGWLRAAAFRGPLIEADLPGELPPEIRIFILAVCIILRRRAAAAAAAAG